MAFACFLCLGGLKAANFENKLEEVEVYILTGSKEDIVNNVVLDDGTILKDYKGKVNIIDNSNIIPFSIGFRSYSKISSFFDYAAWIVRDEYDALSLNPRDNVRNNIISRDMAWNLLSSKRGD